MGLIVMPPSMVGILNEIMDAHNCCLFESKQATNKQKTNSSNLTAPRNSVHGSLSNQLWSGSQRHNMMARRMAQFGLRDNVLRTKSKRTSDMQAEDRVTGWRDETEVDVLSHPMFMTHCSLVVGRSKNAGTFRRKEILGHSS